MKNKNILENMEKFLVVSKNYELKTSVENHCFDNDILENSKMFAKIYNEIKKYKNYNIIVEKYFILAIPKNCKKEVRVVSSHFDNVYDKVFVTEENDYYKGTFDNIIGVLANLSLLEKEYDDVILAFTDAEEVNFMGVAKLNRYLRNKYNVKYYIVLDVTEEKVNTSATIENCNVSVNYNKKDVTVIPNEKCRGDESAYLIKNNARSLSLCFPLSLLTKKENCHNKTGSHIQKGKYEKYVNNLNDILKNKELYF